jgi:hypothetical protein
MARIDVDLTDVEPITEEVRALLEQIDALTPRPGRPVSARPPLQVDVEVDQMVAAGLTQREACRRVVRDAMLSRGEPLRAREVECRADRLRNALRRHW